MDRVKDMVLRGGENVYCSEVETVLFQIEAIAECSVFGVPDDRLGEEVGAAIYLHPGLQRPRIDQIVCWDTDGKAQDSTLHLVVTARCPEMPTASF